MKLETRHVRIDEEADEALQSDAKMDDESLNCKAVCNVLKTLIRLMFQKIVVVYYLYRYNHAQVIWR